MIVADLFCGVGGMSLGFAKAGYDVVVAIDSWPAAVDAYRKGVGSHHQMTYGAVVGDLSSASPIPILGRCDIIIGGPPCQDYSSAGKRVLGEKANLTVSFARIVAGAKPDFFVMENVPGAMKSPSFWAACVILEEHYGLTAVVLDASYYGVPQSRKRLFLVGERGGKDDALAETLAYGRSEKPMTMRDYFGDSLGIEHYYRHPRSYARRGVFSIDEPSPTIRGVNRPIPPGYRPHRGDTADALNGEVRPLTTAERAAVQTFPSWFRPEGTKTDVEQMIGNAVPVNLAYHVAKQIKAYTENKKWTTSI